MTMYKYIVLVALLSPVWAIGKGLPVVARDTADPLIEVMKIEDYYKNAADSSFTNGKRFTWYLNYKQIEEVGDDLILKLYKQMAMRIYRDKIWIDSDSILVVQDSLYCLSIDKRAQVIEISRPQAIYKHILTFDLFDPSLYSNHIHNIITYDSGSTIKRIVYNFKPASPYKSFEVCYDQVNYYLIGIKLYVRNKQVSPEKNMRYIYESGESGLELNQPDKSFFYSSSYIQKQDGQFVPLAPYTGYRIINMLSF